MSDISISDEDEYDFSSEPESDMDMEIEPITSQNAIQSSQHYDLIKREKVFELMNSLLAELEKITQISCTVLRVLLNQFKWDKDRLLERFYDNPRDLFESNCIFYEEDPVDFIVPDSAECQICCDEVEKQHLIGLRCCHFFCKDCYRSYCDVKIMTDGDNQITCPAHRCQAYVEDTLVFDLFSRPNNADDAQVVRKFKKLVVDGFVSKHRAMMFCSTPDCEVVVKMAGPDRFGTDKFGVEINCECGESLCSSCGTTWHDPVQCALLQKWKKKCDDDSETYNWIHANTKECPKCQATIEKDGGCNHIVCRNSSCRYEFCWVCLGSWRAHGSSFYNCNRYNEDESQDARQSQETSRANLQRYLFYYNRFHNHYQSLKFEHRIRKKVKVKMDNLLNRTDVDMSWVEVQFLTMAADILRKSRQCLMFTYVFAFYLKKTNASIIFEDNQGDLERATEGLSELLEKELPDTLDALKDIKKTVQDKARYCDERSKRVIAHVHEGYANDSWEYRNF